MSRRREGATRDLSGLPISPGVSGGILHTLRRWQAEIVNAMRRRLLLDITSSPNKDDLAYFNDIEKFWQTQSLASLLERLFEFNEYDPNITVSSGGGSISSSVVHTAKAFPLGPITIHKFDIELDLAGTVGTLDIELFNNANTEGSLSFDFVAVGREDNSGELLFAHLVDKETARIFINSGSNFNTAAGNHLSLIGFYEREI